MELRNEVCQLVLDSGSLGDEMVVIREDCPSFKNNLVLLCQHKEFLFEEGQPFFAAEEVILMESARRNDERPVLGQPMNRRMRPMRVPCQRKWRARATGFLNPIGFQTIEQHLNISQMRLWQSAQSLD